MTMTIRMSMNASELGHSIGLGLSSY